MKFLILMSAFLFSGSVLAHWTSPVGPSPTKEAVLSNEVRNPSSVPAEKPKK